MPTGYTSDVADGKITDFTEYALQCARAFGACVTLRDEPLSSDIPELEPSDYHSEYLIKTRLELQEFLAMDNNKLMELHREERDKSIADTNNAIKEKKLIKTRYEAMLEKVNSFVSPSPDHDNYVEFLRNQLTESIDWDCDTSYYNNQNHEIPFEVWKTNKEQGLRDDILYHEGHHKEEVDRVKQRNQWISQLKEALR